MTVLVQDASAESLLYTQERERLERDGLPRSSSSRVHHQTANFLQQLELREFAERLCMVCVRECVVAFAIAAERASLEAELWYVRSGKRVVSILFCCVGEPYSVERPTSVVVEGKSWPWVQCCRPWERARNGRTWTYCISRIYLPAHMSVVVL